MNWLDVVNALVSSEAIVCNAAHEWDQTRSRTLRLVRGGSYKCLGCGKRYRATQLHDARYRTLVEVGYGGLRRVEERTTSETSP